MTTHLSPQSSHPNTALSNKQNSIRDQGSSSDPTHKGTSTSKFTKSSCNDRTTWIANANQIINATRVFTSTARPSLKGSSLPPETEFKNLTSLLKSLTIGVKYPIGGIPLADTKSLVFCLSRTARFLSESCLRQQSSCVGRGRNDTDEQFEVMELMFLLISLLIDKQLGDVHVGGTSGEIGAGGREVGGVEGDGNERGLDDNEINELLADCVEVVEMFAGGNCNDCLLILSTAPMRVLTNCLKALGALVYGRSAKCTEVHSKLLKQGGHGLLIRLCDPDELSKLYHGDCDSRVNSTMFSVNCAEIRRMACVCIGNLFYKSSGTITTKYSDSSFQAIVSNISLKENTLLDRSKYNRFMNSAFKSLLHLITSSKNVSVNFLPSIMALLKQHMVYGLSHAMLIHSECAYAVPKEPLNSRFEPLSDQMVLVRGLGADAVTKSGGEAGRRGSAADYSSSGSELSEVETESAKKHKATLTVRHSALLCLQAVLKNTPRKNIYRYWPSFIPDSESPLTSNLFTTIIHDPSPKVRLASIATLMGFLENSRQYLSAADGRETLHSFTSLSRSLGLMAHAMHEHLIAAIAIEKQGNVLTMLFKGLALLVVNSPYERLRKGLKGDVLNVCVHQCFSTHDQNVKVGTLTCLGALLSLPERPKIFEEFCSLVPVEGSACAVDCILELLDKTNPIPVRLEAHQVMVSILKSYFENFAAHFDRLHKIVRSGILDGDPMVRYYSVKVLEEYARSLSIGLNEDKDAWSRLAEEFWNHFLDSHVGNLLEDKSHLVRSSVMDCLSCLNEKVMLLLSSERKVHLLTWASDCCTDDNAHVRAAGCRAMGVFSNFSIFREDILCLSDIGNTLLSCLDDTSINVKVKSCWGIGNLSEALVTCSLSLDKEEMIFFPLKLVYQLMHSCIVSSRGNDKLKASSVRALGNLCKLLTRDSLQDTSITALVDNCLHALVRNMNSGSVKVRWNACHALGHLFENENISLSYSDGCKHAMKNLLHVIQASSNFKVKINAVAAIFSLQSRFRYGESNNIGLIAEALMNAFKNIDQMEDFAEFRYKPTLQRYLEACFVLIVYVMDDTDFPSMADAVGKELDVVYTMICNALELTRFYSEHENERVQEQVVSSLIIDRLNSFECGKKFNRLIETQIEHVTSDMYERFRGLETK